MFTASNPPCFPIPQVSPCSKVPNQVSHSLLNTQAHVRTQGWGPLGPVHAPSLVSLPGAGATSPTEAARLTPAWGPTGCVPHAACPGFCGSQPQYTLPHVSLKSSPMCTHTLLASAAALTGWPWVSRSALCPAQGRGAETSEDQASPSPLTPPGNLPRVPAGCEQGPRNGGLSGKRRLPELRSLLQSKRESGKPRGRAWKASIRTSVHPSLAFI